MRLPSDEILPKLSNRDWGRTKNRVSDMFTCVTRDILAMEKDIPVLIRIIEEYGKSIGVKFSVVVKEGSLPLEGSDGIPSEQSLFWVVNEDSLYVPVDGVSNTVSVFVEPEGVYDEKVS